MSLVVDASVAMKWFVDEPDASEARLLLQYRGGLLAPDLLLLETANACWRLQRRGNLTVAEATAIASGLPSYLTRLVPVGLLHQNAVAIAIDLDHPIYDCCYLALAEMERCKVVTADRRLIGRTEGTRFATFLQPLIPAAS